VARWVRLGFVVSALVVLAGCGRGDEAPAEAGPADGLRMASFDFDGSRLLAELYAQGLEAAGVPVVRLGPIGPRELVAPALELDRIALGPEYLGTALRYAGSTEPNPDSGTALAALNDQLVPRGLVALVPSPAEDKNVIVVTAATADVDKLETNSDLLSYVGDRRFGGPPECPDRPLCRVRLEGVYGVQFAEFVPQRSLAFTAEASRSLSVRHRDHGRLGRTLLP